MFVLSHEKILVSLCNENCTITYLMIEMAAPRLAIFRQGPGG